MKQKIIIIFFISVMASMSCQKEESDFSFDGFEEPATETNVAAEKSKRNIEDAAIVLAEKLNGMAHSSAFETMLQLTMLLDSSQLENSKKSYKSAELPFIASFDHYDKNNGSIAGLLSNLTMADEDDFESFQQEYLDLTGTYTWNNNAGGWDYDEEADSMVIHFPHKSGQDDNNAMFTLKYEPFLTSSSVIEEYYEGDLPGKLKVRLNVNGNALLSHDLSFDYNNEVPVNIKGDLQFEDVQSKFIMNDTDNKTDTVQFTIKKGKKTIASMGLIMNGDFTRENIDDHVYTEENIESKYVFRLNEQTGKMERVLVQDTTTERHAALENIVLDARAFLQLWNIKLYADGNTEQIFRDYNEAFDNQGEEGYDEKKAKTDFSESLNEHTSMYVTYLEKNTIIAGIETFVDEHINYYRTFDPNTGEYKDTTETSYEIDYQLSFSDTSTINMETYYDEEFTILKRRLNNMIETFNSKYSEYDMNVSNLKRFKN